VRALVLWTPLSLKKMRHRPRFGPPSARFSRALSLYAPSHIQHSLYGAACLLL